MTPNVYCLWDWQSHWSFIYGSMMILTLYALIIAFEALSSIIEGYQESTIKSRESKIREIMKLVNQQIVLKEEELEKMKAIKAVEEVEKKALIKNQHDFSNDQLEEEERLGFDQPQ